ncbi:hypothetical protein [Micromonospora sp. LOL_021]|uniref:hypothetical protein n=1 Tax=Micromonospora sp. LOL_021 TaxID=3345417 RepID=UPI003A85A064
MATGGASVCRGTSGPQAAARLNLGSASTVVTSAYRVASQASPPYGSRIRDTGHSVRSRANRGSSPNSS